MRIFIQRALKYEPLHVHGDGTQIRAWCYIDDMVQGTLLVMEHPNSDEPKPKRESRTRGNSAGLREKGEAGRLSQPRLFLLRIVAESG